MADERPDEITTGEAAVLLGISGAMLRRVASQGYIDRHRRGHTTVTSAVQGYAAFLKDDGQRSDVNAVQARSHRAKAAKIRRGTERRRAALTPRAEVEEVVKAVAGMACDRLRHVDAIGLVDGRTARAFAKEIEDACQRIGDAEARALQSLRGQEAEHE
jgi:hypothetical protein